jgi:hypothetical protein
MTATVFLACLPGTGAGGRFLSAEVRRLSTPPPRWPGTPDGSPAITLTGFATGYSMATHPEFQIQVGIHRSISNAFVSTPYFAPDGRIDLHKHWPAQRWAGPYSYGGSQWFKSSHLHHQHER